MRQPIDANPAAVTAAVLVLEPDGAGADSYRRALTPAGPPPAAFDLALCTSPGEAAQASAATAADGRAFAVAFLDAASVDGAGGVELMRRIVAEHRDVRLVLALGDGQPAPAPRGVPIAAYVRKPAPEPELGALCAALAAGQRLLAERDLAQARLQVASRIGRLGHWEWDSHEDHARWCPEFARLLGLPAGHGGGAGDQVWTRIHPDDRARVRAHLARLAHALEARSLEFRIVHPERGVRRLRQESVACGAAGGKARLAVCAVLDVSESGDAEDTVRRLAYFDPLTELPNRSFLNEQLRNVLVHARRHDRTAAILHVDLDGFKRVNETLGQRAGDRVLQETAQRLSSCVRDSDCVARGHGGEAWPAAGSAGAVARFGADEFIVVLSEVASPEDPQRVAERIVERLGGSMRLDGRDVSVGASVGIAVFPDQADNEDALLRNAALAVQAAKRRGRNTVVSFHDALASPGVDRLNLESALRQALDGDGLAMHYQPKVDAHTRRVCGAEALLRWRHPRLGMIPPGDFIPIAEECGLIGPLGDWVVRQVCAQMAAWRERGLEAIPVSINVSPQQLQDSALVHKVRRELERAGLTPPALEFEITESVMMEQSGAAESRLRELQALGSLVSLDDFGTGYSSLSYLKRLPIDVVKIDRAFVRDILAEADDQAILQAIITMAHRLRLRIVAEGVESEAQVQLLQRMNCDLIQGYVVSPALAADEFARRFLVDAHRMVS